MFKCDTASAKRLPCYMYRRNKMMSEICFKLIQVEMHIDKTKLVMSVYFLKLSDECMRVFILFSLLSYVYTFFVIAKLKRESKKCQCLF